MIVDTISTGDEPEEVLSAPNPYIPLKLHFLVGNTKCKEKF